MVGLIARAVVGLQRRCYLIMLECVLGKIHGFLPGPSFSTSDFQSEVGEVLGEIGGELPAKFGRRFSSFFCWG